MSTDIAAIRRELLTLAQRVACRINISTDECPCRWNPHEVRHPQGGTFTTKMAWEFIVDLLESGSPDLQEIELRKPPGRKGYVLLVDLGHERPLYIKLQLRGGKVIGRSFHYSYSTAETDQ